MLYKIKEVDVDKCNSCEKCAKVCHADCFEMNSKNDKIVAKFVNIDKCDACGDCIVACSNEGQAIVLEPLANQKKGYVESIDKDKCAACGKCINLCPCNNIELTEENGKIFAKIIDPEKCIADGNCSFGCDCKIRM